MKLIFKTMLVVSLLGVSFTAQAQSQKQTPNIKTTKMCFEAYYGTNIYASANANKSFGFAISTPVLKTDFSLRVYRSGKALPAQARIEMRKRVEETMSALFKKEFNLGLDLYDSSGKTLTQRLADQQFSIYRKQIEQCDANFNIPYIVASKAWNNTLTDRECITNYATLLATNRTQVQKKYFNDRSIFAARVDEVVMERKTGAEEQIFKSAQAQGLQIAQKSFNHGGTPDFGEIIESHEWVQQCDAKYGLIITEIPESLYLAASGKLREKR